MYHSHHHRHHHITINPSLQLTGHSRAVTALAVSDGLVYSASNDMTVRLWEEATGRPVATLAKEVDPPSSLSVLRSTILTATHTSGGEWRCVLCVAPL